MGQMQWVAARRPAGVVAAKKDEAVLLQLKNIVFVEDAAVVSLVFQREPSILHADGE